MEFVPVRLSDHANVQPPEPSGAIAGPDLRLVTVATLLPSATQPGASAP
jgi:hypothetical protein